MKIFNTAVPEY